MRTLDYGTAMNGTLQAGMSAEKFCGLLKLISNPNRLRILLHLRAGESAVGELESALETKQPNLSHELRKLRDHGLVATRRQSKVIFYSLSDVSTARLVDGLVEFREKLTQPMPGQAANGDGNRPADPEPGRNDPASGNGECGQFAVVHHPNSTI